MEAPNVKKHPPPTVHIPDLSIVKIEDADLEGTDVEVQPNPASLAPIIPKVEKGKENQVFDLDKIPKTERCALTYSDDVFSSSSNIEDDLMVTINVGNLDFSCLNEELDLGTEVKIAGLGDTLPIPELPRPIDRSTIVTAINIKTSPDKRTRDRIESSGDEDKVVKNKSTVRPKDRDKTKIVYGANRKVTDVDLGKRVNTDSDCLLVEKSKKNTLMDVVMLDEESNRELFEEDEVIGELNLMENIDTDTPFYGNRIILGKKNKSKKVADSVLNEKLFNTKVVLQDCAEKLKRNKRYCRKCNVLFSNMKAFDRHNIDEKVTKTNDAKKSVIGENNYSEKVVNENANRDKELDLQKCGVCHSVLSNKYKVLTHAKNIHNIEPDQYKKMFYSNTTKKTKSKDDKREFIQNDEIRDLTNPNYCTHCQKVFLNKEMLVKHLYSMLAPETEAPETNDDQNNKSDSKTLKKVKKTDLDKIREEVIREATSKLKDVTKYKEDNKVSDSESSDFDNTDDDDSYRQSPSISSKSDYSSDDDVPISKLCQDTPFYDNEDTSNDVIGEECLRCDEILNTKVERAKHELEHTNLDARNAKDCFIVVENLSFEQIKDKTEQIAIENSEEEPLYLRCPICFVYLERDYEDMLYHMDKYHNNLKKSQRKPESYIYACKYCEKKFNTFDRTLKHIRDNHPGNTRVGNIKRVDLFLPDDPYVSPVSKSVLFKCKKCSLHFFTAFAAETHLRKCSSLKNYWECPKCRNKFKSSQQKTHELQHLFSDRFDVYTVKNSIHFHVLCKCPLCGVHFTEETFLDHYHRCENTSPKAVYCLQCDFLIDSNHINAHKEDHEAINTEDFIIVDYEIPKVETKSGIPAKKMKLELVEIEDSDFEEYRKSKKVQMLYCSTCKSYLSDLWQPQTAHYEKACKNMPKEMCGQCGLVFTNKLMEHHKEQHKKGFKFKNATFYDLNFQQIDPPFPQLPLCPICWIYFKDTNEKRDHECKSTLHVKCGFCRKEFSTACHDLHLSFHMYKDYKCKTPLRRTAITQIQKLLLKSKDKNFLYLCVHCDLVITGDKVESHQMKSKCEKDVLRQCSKCQLKFEIDDYLAHLRKHENKQFGKNVIVVPFDRKSDIKVSNEASDFDLDENTTEFNDKVTKMDSSREDTPLADYANQKVDEIQANHDGTTKHINEKIENDINLPEDDISKHKFESNDKYQKVLNSIEDEPRIDETEANKNTKPDLIKAKTKTATLYKCSCGLHFMTEIAIFEHFSTCMETCQNQKCPKCALLFTPSVLFDHLLAHHGKGRKFTFKIVEILSHFHADKNTLYKCMKCELHFLTESFAEEHLKHCDSYTRPTRQEDLCTHCGLRFDVTMMKFHRTRHHGEKKFNIDAFEIINFGENVITAADDTEIEKQKEIDIQKETETENPKTSETVNIKADELKSYKDAPNKIYKCTKCDIHYLSLKGAQRHVKNHAAVSPNQGYCGTCKLTFANYSIHVEVHHDMYNYKVEDLEIITDLPKVKKRTKILVEEQIKNIIYRCPDCDVYFLTVSDLYRHVHLAEHKMSPPAIYCDICKKHYGILSLITFNWHIDNHHTKKKLKFDDFEVRNYPVRESMEIDSKYSNKLYTCTLCNACSISTREKFIHRNKCPRSPINNVECNDCHIKFHSGSILEHKRFHHDQNNFKKEDFSIMICDNLEPKRKPKSRDQMRKIYKCKSCEVYFYRKGTCINHVVKNHKSVYILHKSKCVKCNITFQKQSLTFHLRYHHKQYNFTPKDFIIQEYDHMNLGDTDEPLFKTYPFIDTINLDNTDDNKKKIKNKQDIEKEIKNTDMEVDITMIANNEGEMEVETNCNIIYEFKKT